LSDIKPFSPSHLYGALLCCAVLPSGLGRSGEETRPIFDLGTWKRTADKLINQRGNERPNASTHLLTTAITGVLISRVQAPGVPINRDMFEAPPAMPDWIEARESILLLLLLLLHFFSFFFLI
jgi:hypothetical protein